MTAHRKSYDAWFQDVDFWVSEFTGVSALDLVDFDYQSAYEDGRSAKSTAKAAIRNCDE